MPALNISKVAVGCSNLEALRRRQAGRIVDERVPILTRFRPKRADELVGGSIYWIIKHQVAARQAITGFGLDEDSRRTIITLAPDLVPVRPQPRRAHQGWRYLDPADAPRDLGAGDSEVLELPPELLSRLSALALI
jgi:hypothetical protein